MLNAIVSEMVSRGYEAEVVNVVKNGVGMTGIVVGKGENVKPTIYKHSEWDNMSIEDVCNEVEKIYEENKMEDINTEMLSDIDFIKENAKICLQKKGKEDIAKRDYLDMELYIRVDLFKNPDGVGSYKLPAKLETEEIWEHAIKNTEDSFNIIPMNQMLSGFLDIEDDTDYGMYVVMNDNKTQAGSALYYKDIFKDFCAKRNMKGCYILPSSIHEIIIYSGNIEGVTLKKLSELVSEVNATQVAEHEQLSDHAYYYNAELDEITY